MHLWCWFQTKLLIGLKPINFKRDKVKSSTLFIAQPGGTYVSVNRLSSSMLMACRLLSARTCLPTPTQANCQLNQIEIRMVMSLSRNRKMNETTPLSQMALYQMIIAAKILIVCNRYMPFAITIFKQIISHSKMQNLVNRVCHLGGRYWD